MLCRAIPCRGGQRKTIPGPEGLAPCSCRAAEGDRCWPSWRSGAGPAAADPCSAKNLPQLREVSASPQSPGSCLLQLLPELPALAIDKTDFRLLLCPRRSRALSQGLDLCLQAEGRVVNKEGRFSEPRCVPELFYSSPLPSSLSPLSTPSCISQSLQTLVSVSFLRNRTACLPLTVGMVTFLRPPISAPFFPVLFLLSRSGMLCLGTGATSVSYTASTTCLFAFLPT